ncbi:hypothetical protein SO694_00017353 [Aureococcus anophagefferens]|uniref:Uncharacterized protein n=1 Tax=Aureococcus anophagefferens TaxID=44056 RepID=A0ABR1G2F9_AURAN
MDDRASSVTGAKAAEQYLAHHHAANDDDDDDLDAALVAAMLEADVRESAVPVTTGLQVMASPAELDRVEALFARLEAGDALAGGGAALPEERMRRVVHGGCLQKVGTEATFKREHAREVFVLNDALIVATRADGEKHGWWRGSGASSATDDDDDGTCPLLAKQCVPWADVLYVEDLRWDLAASHAKPCFEIGTTARSFRFLAADAADLDGWLRPGQDKRAKFPTSKAPFSAVFHSFRLIFGRAIISRNGRDDLDARDGDGFAPLHYAAYAGDARAVRSLVDAGADAGAAASPPPGATGDAADFAARAPLHAAACPAAALRALLEAGGADDAAAGGETALGAAAARGHARACEMLCRDLGRDPRTRPTTRGTPLHRAAANGDEATVAALLAAGARPNAVGRDGRTPSTRRAPTPRRRRPWSLARAPRARRRR